LVLFLQKKNEDSSFSEEKAAKRLLILGARLDRMRYLRA
jgi:hypothetical protein